MLEQGTQHNLEWTLSQLPPSVSVRLLALHLMLHLEKSQPLYDGAVITFETPALVEFCFGSGVANSVGFHTSNFEAIGGHLAHHTCYTTLIESIN